MLLRLCLVALAFPLMADQGNDYTCVMQINDFSETYKDLIVGAKQGVWNAKLARHAYDKFKRLTDDKTCWVMERDR